MYGEKARGMVPKVIEYGMVVIRGKEEADASHAVCIEEAPVRDLTVEEYTAISNTSDFFRPAAVIPMMDAGWQAFVCSLLEDKSPWLPEDTGEFTRMHARSSFQF